MHPSAIRALPLLFAALAAGCAATHDSRLRGNERGASREPYAASPAPQGPAPQEPVPQEPVPQAPSFPYIDSAEAPARPYTPPPAYTPPAAEPAQKLSSAYTLKVSGMTCPSKCVREVREMLTAVPGVTNVIIDFDTKRVICHVEVGTDPATLVAALKSPYSGMVIDQQ